MFLFLPTDKMIYYFQIWRHTCLSMSRTTGKFKLVENGKVVADKISDDIIKYMEKIPVQVTIFTFFSFQ